MWMCMCGYRADSVCANARVSVCVCVCGRVNSVECECRKCRCKQRTSSTTTTSWQPAAVCVRVLRCNAALSTHVNPPPPSYQPSRQSIWQKYIQMHSKNYALDYDKQKTFFFSVSATATTNTATAVYSFDAQLQSQQRHSSSSSSSRASAVAPTTTTLVQLHAAMHWSKKKINNQSSFNTVAFYIKQHALHSAFKQLKSAFQMRFYVVLFWSFLCFPLAAQQPVTIVTHTRTHSHYTNT